LAEAAEATGNDDEEDAKDRAKISRERSRMECEKRSMGGEIVVVGPTKVDNKIVSSHQQISNHLGPDHGGFNDHHQTKIGSTIGIARTELTIELTHRPKALFWATVEVHATARVSRHCFSGGVQGGRGNESDTN
jgi:hypothetical protein